MIRAAEAISGGDLCAAVLTVYAAGYIRTQGGGRPPGGADLKAPRNGLHTPACPSLLSAIQRNSRAQDVGTLVTIHVVGECDPDGLDRAFGWFHEIERRCTRFDAASDLMQLCSRAGQAVAVSPILFEAIRFALLVADESGGAFDPAVGHRTAACGFNREHRTGEAINFVNDGRDVGSFRDIQVDLEQKTITLLRPLVLDLGALRRALRSIWRLGSLNRGRTSRSTPAAIFILAAGIRMATLGALAFGIRGRMVWLPLCVCRTRPFARRVTTRSSVGMAKATFWIHGPADPHAA
jgi:hypothetical protein